MATLLTFTACGEGGYEFGGVNVAMSHLDPAIVTASRLFGVSGHHVIKVVPIVQTKSSLILR